MLRKKSGQSIIEYSLLAMLVITGVIVMGPVLLRSINAHFKLWQEPIEDSIHDQMVKKPTSATPMIQGCTCSDFQPGDCGAHFQRSNVSCKPSERYYSKTCSPADCIFSSGFAEECRPDATSCCNKFNFCSTLDGHSLHGDCCGKVQLPSAGFSRGQSTNEDGFPPVATPTNPLDYGAYCYYGEEALIKNCHNPLNPQPGDVRCMPIPIDSPYPDAGQCGPICTNIPNNSSLCPGASENLTQDTISTVSSDCQVQQIQSNSSTASEAGGVMQYTSPMLNTPLNISVNVHTEDLNFRIKFFDSSNNLIHEEFCLDNSGVSSVPLPGQLNNSCDGWQGKDDDYDIDTYQTSFIANKVEIYVREGGDAGSSSMGYDIYAASVNCCPDYTTNPNTQRCVAFCSSNHYADNPTHCNACPDAQTDPIEPSSAGHFLPGWPNDHNYHCTTDPNDPNNATNLCHAYGYNFGGYFPSCQSWSSPNNKGYISINPDYPNVASGYEMFDWVGPDGKTVHFRWCTGCANDNWWADGVLCNTYPPQCLFH